MRLPICVRALSPRCKCNAETKLFGRLSYEKIRRYNNFPPYVMARWPPQQIPPLNFLGLSWCVKDIRKPNLALKKRKKKLEDPQFLNYTRAPNVPWIFGLLRPLAVILSFPRCQKYKDKVRQKCALPYFNSLHNSSTYAQHFHLFQSYDLFIHLAISILVAVKAVCCQTTLSFHQICVCYEHWISTRNGPLAARQTWHKSFQEFYLCDN